MGRVEQLRANIRRAYLAGRATVRPNSHEDLDDDPIALAEPSVNGSRSADQQVPYPLRIAAAWSWRMLIVAAAGTVVLWVVAKLHQVVIPVAIAMLMSALLSPAVVWLRKRVRLHRSLATAIVMVGGLALVAGTLTLVITQFVSSWEDLSQKAQGGIQQIQGWLKRGPLHLSDQQLNSIVSEAQRWLTDHRSTLTTGAVSTATTAIDVLASTFLVLFCTFFFLRDGRRIWRFLVRLLPAGGREPLGSAGDASWQTLVARGPVWALAVLLLVIGVQQLEGHVLQPAIMGKAVAIHPLAVIVAIATGVVLAGIVGALVAVPIVAVLNTGIRHLAARRSDEPEPGPPTEVVVRG